MFKKTIISEFFTTINFSIFINTLALLTYKIWYLKYSKYNILIEKKILSYIQKPDSKIISFYNWRSAIFHCLKMLGLSKNDEVIVSWYTCITVSNAVIQSGAKIIYSDINNSLQLDLKSLQKNITNNTKVIIIQHTFWFPSDLDKILEIAKQKNIIVIEDCAHSLWSEYKSKKIWSFGDFSIFSTGRDKVISSVTWWFLVINNKKYFNFKTKIEKKLKTANIKLILQNLFYNIVAYKAYKLYDFFKLGRFIIYISRKIWLITEILTNDEKNCNYKEFNYKLPWALAYLWYLQLEKIDKINFKRISFAKYYNENIKNPKIEIIFKNNNNNIKNNYFRYAILLKDKVQKELLYNYMKKNNILLWNTWSSTNIVPINSNIKKAKYYKNSCPKSEDISERILTLPNHYNLDFKDIEKVTKLLNNF